MRLNFFLTLFLSLLIPGTVWPAAAQAVNKLEKIQMKPEASSVAVDILFQRPVSAARVRATLERNFIQVALRSTSMDQARILPVGKAGNPVDKVFAYPYSPDTVRIRMIAGMHQKWDAAWMLKNVSVKNVSPRVLRISVGEPALLPVAQNPEEKELIKEVLTNTKEIDLRNPDAIKTTIIQTKETAKEASKELVETGPVGSKAEPSRYFLRMVLSLVAVLALFGVTILGLKKFGGTKGLPFGKKERIIQVVATHYLGAKKSISLVKVAGEYIVLGTSNEGVSLISKLGPEINVDKYLEDRFWGGTFENHLKSYTKDVMITKDAPQSANYDGVRDLAAPKKRPEALAPPEAPGSSVRMSIKEKLTKLKPLT